jgi:malic enzyme
MADELLAGADVYLGLSGPGAVSAAAVRTMGSGAIVFAMANPTPEVQPEDVSDHVRIMATGRSDYPNQMNNVLAFPGVFRGALDVRASTINEEMKLAAAQAIASVVSNDDSIPSTSSRACSIATWRLRSRSRSRTRRKRAASPAVLDAPRRGDVRGRRLNERARVVRKPVWSDQIRRGGVVAGVDDAQRAGLGAHREGCPPPPRRCARSRGSASSGSRASRS